MKTRFLKTCAIFLLGVSLISCGKEQKNEEQTQEPNTQEQTEETAKTEAKKSINDEVIVWVNDTPITHDELDLNIDRTLGSAGLQFMNAKLRERILNSLISSRAIAHLAEKKMSEEELKALDLKMKAYREELLVKRYLQEEITPEPISGEQVKAYYEKHPEEFGAGITRKFELIESIGKPTEEQRRMFLKKFANIKKQKNWKRLVQTMKKKGLQLNYRIANANIKLLKNPLASIVRKTEVGQVSPVHFSDQMLIVRVLDEKRIAPKPIHEVSAEIRKKIAPSNLRKAVQALSEKARKEATIRYNNTESETP